METERRTTSRQVRPRLWCDWVGKPGFAWPIA